MCATFLILTSTLLEDEVFKRIFSVDVNKHRLKINTPGDLNIYYKFECGKHTIFYINTQSGTGGTHGSQASVFSAIGVADPDGVISVGISFSRDEEKQIGDIVVSTSVQDYIKGKMKEEMFQPDGQNNRCGPILVSAFTGANHSWNHEVPYDDNTKIKVKVYFGTTISGDRVVDSETYKNSIEQNFPRYADGEMEGNGISTSCGIRGISEWIVLKAICDYGKDKSKNKDEYQKFAAESAMTFLKYALVNEDKFINFPSKKEDPQRVNCGKSYDVIRYYISIGKSSCRLLEVANGDINQIDIQPNNIESESIGEYEDKIISCVNNFLNIIEKKEGSYKVLTKVFVDYHFDSIFKGDNLEKKDFIRRFYEETGLFFNILTLKQTESNLRNLKIVFETTTAIIDIGKSHVDLTIVETGRSDKKDDLYTLQLPINIKKVKEFVNQNNYNGIWDKSKVRLIKTFILSEIKNELPLLSELNVKKTYIIKNELTFMKDMDYRLINDGGEKRLTQSSYVENNYRILFNRDYEDFIQSRFENDAEKQHRYPGFRYGHIIIETILSKMNNESVVPIDDIGIYGTTNPYLFNIVLCGSTKEDKVKLLYDAKTIFDQMDVTITSPRFDNNNKLLPISKNSEYEHLKAIDDCDVLFVCNDEIHDVEKDSRNEIGIDTRCEIYYAYALNKPIVFWRKMKLDDRLQFMNIEYWDDLEYFAGAKHA